MDPALVKLGARRGLNGMYELLKSGDIEYVDTVHGVSENAGLQNFYRMEFKPSNDPQLLKPYPLIEDGTAYIALPIQGQTASKKAIRRRNRSLGVKWGTSESTVSFYGSTVDIRRKLYQLMEAGIEIKNVHELSAEFKELKKMPIRN